jgi:hypothetical protein
MPDKTVTSDLRLPSRAVADRYSVCLRTIVRWHQDPDLNFPKPIIVNRRRYYLEAELTAWDRANAGRLAAA